MARPTSQLQTSPATWPPRYDDDYRPAPDSPYWLEAQERQDPEARAREILRKIQATMRWAWERAPFYRDKWKAAGLEPGDIKSLEDFSRVPVLTKHELREDQIAHPPFGSYLCIEPREIFHLHGTSGTTGKPTTFAVGRDDWHRIANAHARVMWGFGLRPGDTVFFGSFFSLYMGGWGALAGAERLGCVAFPFGAGVPGQTLQAIRWLREIKPTAFYGTPSYGLYVAEKARQEGIDPKEFGLRILFFSGEPGASIPATKRRIEEAYGGICVDTGSTAEMTPWMTNGECAFRTGMHLWQDIVYTELLHPETKAPVPFGGEGVPVYTHLERTSQPMIRFWSGDLASWTDEPCECGRTYPRLPRGIYGRVDDMFIVRGENIYPSAIEEVLRAVPGVGEEFRIVISREEAMDELLVEAEYTREMAARAEKHPRMLDALRKEIAERLRATVGVWAKVRLMPPDALPRTEFKARRVIDNRDLFRELRSKE